MSDSDSELLLPNVFTLQNERTIVSARGPNINANITGLSFRNNVMSSTMQMRNNFERQRYAESNYDQQSMYRRRGTSPMSIMSACDMRQRKFNNSYYTQGMSSQRSAFNGRSGSPMSTRSIDSSASVIAADIAMYFNKVNFNKHDERIIKNAYNKYMKQKIRKRIEKRRKLRRFLERNKPKYGEDSGEQGSNSSLSSDDRSITTSNYKENMSSCRSTKTDTSNYKRTINNVYKDCTDNSSHISARSMTCAPINLNTQSSVTSLKSITGSNISSFRRMPLPANFNKMQRKQPISEMTQKDRFKSGLLLPSQRFVRSTASSIPENAENVYHSERNNLDNGKGNRINIETDSDQDDIFSETTTKKKVDNVIQRKRSIDSDDDICLPSQKRTKMASPYKNGIDAKKPKPKDTNLNTHNNCKGNDFVFAKPTFPVKKYSFSNNLLLDSKKVISKSAAPSKETLVHASIIPHVNIHNSTVEKNVEQGKEQDLENESSNSTQSTTNLSMKPSFIKRKLFTQKLDVSEKRNMSTESINSPQNSIYSSIQKEKHKARKLQQVTTQSCLSRDLQQDESNLLDLIHKVVPLEQMNITNQTNKTDIQLSRNKNEENQDKWDVTSIISARKNDDDESDTYTDEEIFNATIKELAKDEVSKKLSPIKGKKELPKEISNKLSPMKGKKQVTKENSIKKPSPMKNKNCNVLVEKLPHSSLQSQKKMAMNDVAIKSVQQCIKSFWDTDFESDAECQPSPRIGNLNFTENNGKEILHPKENSNYQGFSSMSNSKKPATASMTNASTYINNTVDSLRKFDIPSLRIRSHRTPTKRKKLEQTRDEKEKSILCEPQSKKQTTLQVRSCKELYKPDSQAKTDIQREKSKETMSIPHSKHQNKKLPITQKKALKTDKHNDSTDGELPTKKQTNSTKTQLKTGHNEPKTINNENDTVQCKQDTEKESTKNKPNKTTQKSNNKTTQSQQKGNNKKQDIKDNEQLKKQSNRKNTRDKLTQDDKKDQNQTHSSKKPAETRRRNKKQSPKIKNTTKSILPKNNSSPNKDTNTEENNNCRPVRSCRISKQDKTLDETNMTLNGCRTLRSRQIDLFSTSNENIKNATQNIKDSKSRISDVSFSLGAKNKALSKRDVTKVTNSHLFKAKDIETSDVSFSLTINESPTPKKAISRAYSKAKNSKKTSVTKSTPLKKSAVQSKDISFSKNELKRKRTPNKRYMMC